MLKPSPKKILGEEDLIELATLLRHAFAFISKLKGANPAAAPIQYPKVPPIFSESLIVHCIPTLFSHASDIRLGGKWDSDIIFNSPTGQKRVEVKATGKQNFQNLGEKDLASDYLIWVAFGEFFSNAEAEEPIVIYVLVEPARVFPNSRKIALRDFIRIATPSLDTYQGTLSELLRGQLVRIPTSTT